MSRTRGSFPLVHLSMGGGLRLIQGDVGKRGTPNTPNPGRISAHCH